MLHLIKRVQSSPKPASADPHHTFDSLLPIRQWLNNVEIRHAMLAHLICRIIPIQCPFERDIYLFNRTLLHIPPLCKLNPLYGEVVGLRFRALCYLAEICGEGVRCYC